MKELKNEKMNIRNKNRRICKGQLKKTAVCAAKQTFPPVARCKMPVASRSYL